jgi:hypothetical protein
MRLKLSDVSNVYFSLVDLQLSVFSSDHGVSVSDI